MQRVTILVLAGVLAGCITPPPAPPAPYRAVGEEPGWTLIIDDQHVTFIRADQSVVREARPTPVTTTAGLIYPSPRIRVTIVRAQCREGASGAVYPDRVQVDLDGRRFNGCGGL